MKQNSGSSLWSLLLISGNVLWCSGWGMKCYFDGDYSFAVANAILACTSIYLVYNNRMINRGLQKIRQAEQEHKEEMNRLLAPYLESDDITKDGKHDA